MRTDKEHRSKNNREIDEFLSQFDEPQDKELTSLDLETYIEKDRASSEKADSETGGRRRSKRDKKDQAKKSRRASKGKQKKSLKYRLFLKDNPDYDPSLGATYQKNGKTIKNKPTKVSIKKVIRDLFVLGVVMALIALVYSFVVITSAPKINPKNIYDTVAQSSIIYDDQGNEVDSVYYDQDRKLVSYEDLPENLINAFVALEDKTFWDHHGFNWTRMIGAVFQAIFSSGNVSGTSTITQQLARNVYLPDIKSQRSIKRKIIEMYYASQIERALSKEEIIEAYLNTVYFGFGNYGIYNAAHTYYSKDPKDLTLVQCASLAALPQAPDTYALIKYMAPGNVTEDTMNIIARNPDTYVANDVAKNRRQTCLKFMYEQGYISKEDYEANKDLDLIDFIDPDISNNQNAYSYFKEYMVDAVTEDLMEKYDLSAADAERMIYTGGLNIYSTMDSTAQRVITKEFQDASNFPTLTNIRTDGSGNILDSSGNIMLYKYSNMFNADNQFVLNASEVTVNEDGSVTVKRGHRLNIYTTKVKGVTDYSLEFKQIYTSEEGVLYIYSGGYINIPAKYKTLDDEDNLVISADYFKDYEGLLTISGDTVIINRDAYSLNPKTIQPQAAMVIVEVGTGELKAMVGGRNQTGSRLYNRALNPRQPGSSIKPLSVYSAALQKSYELQSKGQKWPFVNTGHDKQGTKYYGDYLTASSVIIDEPMTFNGQTWPQNSTRSFSGAVTMRKALQQSINTVAVKIQLQVGNEFSADLLEKYGLSTVVTEGSVSDMNSAALALGGMTKGAIPLEMAQAYATFPNGGVRQSTISYTKVTDRNGKTLLTAESEGTKVLDEGVAWIMTDMLRSVVTNGLGTPAATSGVAAGGKTGTTDQNYDIWFDGFTPTYAASLWIGTDVNIRLSSMSYMSARLWGRIMNQIPAALTGSYKARPSNVIYSGGEYYTTGTNTGRVSVDKVKGETDEDKDKNKDKDKDKEKDTSKKPSSSGSGSQGGGSTGGSSGGGTTEGGGSTGGGGSTEGGGGTSGGGETPEPPAENAA